MSDAALVSEALARRYARRPSYPAFLPNVVDPSPEEAAILKEIEAGLELHEQGKLWQAEKVYRRVAERHNSPRARALLGILLHQKDGSPGGLEMAREGCEADRDDMLIHGNYGGAVHMLGRVGDAIEAYTRAVEAAPYYSEAWVGLGSCFADVMRHREAVYAYRQGVTYDPARFTYWSDLVFTTDLSDAHTFADSLAVRREINDRIIRPLMAERIPHRNDPDPDRPLEIGYASADMYQHSGALTWGGWLRNHDRSRYRVTLYSATLKHDDMTEAFKASCDRWHDIQDWTDDQLAVQVVKDKIDIFVDLAGYSRGGRIPAFGRCPAPIQVSGWGYATGLGLDCMAAFATDPIVVSQYDEGGYHEQPYRLPSALSWVPPAERTLIDGQWSGIPVGPVRATLGRPFTFGVFNRQPKITRSFIKACAEILKRTPGSMLVIKNGRLDHPQVRDAIDRAFEEEGITEPRVALFGQGNHWNHLASHWVADVVLDPFPQGGGVSAFETLWMGRPMVTLLGDRPSGRIAASLLHQVDLADWVANDVETYVERAVAAARDLQRLEGIREALRERVYAMPATQLESYARDVEAWYRSLWQRWCRERTAGQETAA